MVLTKALMDSVSFILIIKDFTFIASKSDYASLQGAVRMPTLILASLRASLLSVHTAILGIQRSYINSLGGFGAQIPSMLFF